MHQYRVGQRLLFKNPVVLATHRDLSRMSLLLLDVLVLPVTLGAVLLCHKDGV